MDNIEIILDTLKRCNKGILKYKTVKAVKNTRIYPVGFSSSKSLGEYDTVIDFACEGTLEVAKKLVFAVKGTGKNIEIFKEKFCTNIC